MVIFAALFMVLFTTVLFGHALEALLRLLSGNQNIDVGIRGNTEAGEEVLETLTHSPPSPRAGGSEFEVFLSFRGEDIRKRFIGHLYEGLEERNISTFIDSEKLKKGEEINKLFEYTERSKIFVPIFSERFAESKWCLKEVTKSVECGKEIVPVFFGVEPSDVRNQSGPFKSAFKDHQSNKKQNQEEVRKWRETLKKVANLSGFNLKDMNGDEAKLKRAVIEIGLDKVNKKPLEVAKHPIGIESHVEIVKKMLENGDNINDVHVVGIHGMGGLGKTTIAKAVYNEYLTKGFNGANCFLSNIREKSAQPNGLVDLQKQLIGEVLKEKNISVSDAAQGKFFIKDSASRKRVLLILDDVDSVEQLDALAGGRDWFGSGSLIIITTRDEEVLLASNVKQDEIYKPQELNEDQSRELFMLHAFSGEQPQGEFVNLSHQLVAAAGGLPLTLEVFGSLLSSKRNVQQWKYTLEKLKRIPPSRVQQRKYF
ncbi:disease resistance protein Roq1-like [Nymphaea colorata]|nr:disease resistance protein Roq1-like [Nymphaea colorata]